MVSHGYRVTIRQGWDGEEHVIHSERTDKFRLLMCQVTKDVTAYDSLEIQITPDQPQYANFHQFTTFVKVTRPDLHKTIFEGRVITPNDEMDTGGAIFKDVICEGLEGFLHDSVQPFAEFHNTTPKDFLQAIITNHNNQVDAYKQIKLGNVTVTNSTDNVYRFLEDDKDTYNNIIDKLVSRLGGEIRVRHEPAGLYLDYEPQIGGKSAQKIELGKNLLSLQRAIDASTFYTALKPLGATQEPKTTDDSTNNTNVSYPRLTIGGDGLIRNEALISKFGMIVKANDWDDVTMQADLRNKGQAMMGAQKNLKTQIQLTYVDLSYINKDLDSFNNGDTVELVSKIQGIDLIERITGMVINCVNVASSTMTIGEDDMNQSSYEAMNLAQANAANKTLAKMINEQAKQLAEIKSNSNTQYEELAKKNAELQAAIEQLEGKANGGAIIDVSEFQSTIDWPTVVKAGLSLAVIRVQSGTSHEDLTYKTNIPAVINLDANYAVYAYNAAISVDDAKNEATNFYNRAQAVIGSGKQPRFWMIDVEEKSMDDMRSCITSYMNTLNSLGVPDNKIVLYIANQLYDSFNLDVARAGAVWIPSYGKNDGTVAGSSKPDHPYDLWQYTSKGHIAGITQNTVDLSTDPSARFKENYLD
ncbi:phage tail spike protein [Loigolactobacillus coryniformis]|uniref:phage tail spike protein n=1 Tax=Loigolactobacillus coryniformis TaxID=1610 RepID=UPI003F28542A